jgi:hypothetical protein
LGCAHRLGSNRFLHQDLDDLSGLTVIIKQHSSGGFECITNTRIFTVNFNYAVHFKFTFRRLRCGDFAPARRGVPGASCPKRCWNTGADFGQAAHVPVK